MDLNGIELEDIVKRVERIGIAAHDAGGAAVLAAFITQFDEYSFFSRTDGPAQKIINSSNITGCESDENLLENIDFLLLGSGSTDYEKKLLRKAKAGNVTTGVILDHFVNYKSRFVMDNEVVYPDVCYVCDDYSYDIARSELDNIPRIKKCKNYLLEEWRTLISLEGVEKKTSALYVLENIKENWGGVEDPWRIAFSNFYKFYCSSEHCEKIIVRPHPKDDPSIYKDLSQYPGVTFDLDPSPIKSLSQSRFVVGVESYFMYLAHLLGYEVFTSLPTKLRLPRLPPHSYKYFP